LNQPLTDSLLQHQIIAILLARSIFICKVYNFAELPITFLKILVHSVAPLIVFVTIFTAITKCKILYVPMPGTSILLMLQDGNENSYHHFHLFLDREKESSFIEVFADMDSVM
jgi:hypothetical protein